MSLNSLPNDKFLDVTKLKAFADEKLNLVKMTIFSLIQQKTLWENEKMLVTRIFSFAQYFPEPSSSGLLKVRTVW